MYGEGEIYVFLYINHDIEMTEKTNWNLHEMNWTHPMKSCSDIRNM